MKLLATFLFVHVVLYAHPHIFIDIYPKLNLQNDKVTSLSLEWKFDQMTSSVLIMDYDKNKNNKLDKKEIALIKRKTQKLFKAQNYYLKIITNDKNIKIKKLDNFVATIDNSGRMVYSYDLICSFDVKDSIVMFYDKDYYIAIKLKKSFIEPLNKNLDFDIKKVDNGTYFGYAMFNKGIK